MGRTRERMRTLRYVNTDSELITATADTCYPGFWLNISTFMDIIPLSSVGTSAAANKLIRREAAGITAKYVFPRPRWSTISRKFVADDVYCLSFAGHCLFLEPGWE